MNAASLSGPTERSMTPAMRASRLLGWVSFAIGAAELIAPGRLGRAVGVGERNALLRAYGGREIVAGVGVHSVYPVPALWSRVGGDLLDLATLAVAGRRAEGRTTGNWVAMGAVAAITAVDLAVALRMTDETRESKGEQKDYSNRSGFPGGVEAARGAGIAGGEQGGKAGGAAAGDGSPAGKSPSGRAQTDNSGAPLSSGGSGGATGQGSGGATSGSTSGGAIGGGQVLPPESREAVPQAPSYTPA